MSVKRYTLEMASSEIGEIQWMHDNNECLSAPLGEYVLHSDYVALQAELDRLRKAGDELVYWVGCDEYPERVITEWKAAKEGKPSA